MLSNDPSTPDAIRGNAWHRNPEGRGQPYQINGRAFLLAGSQRDAQHEELLTIDAGAVKKVCGFRTQGTWRVTKLVLP